MSTQTQPSTELVIASLEDVDAAMIRLRQIRTKQNRREAAYKATNERRKARFDERSAPGIAEEAGILEALKQYLGPQRDELIRTYGKVIDGKQGTIAWRNTSETVDLPKNLEETVGLLLGSDDGPQALERAWQVSKKAITGLTDATKEKLREIGARIGRRENLTVKPHRLEKPILVDSRVLDDAER